MKKILILLLFTGNIYGQTNQCSVQLLDSLFSSNFKRIDNHFSKNLNETIHLSLQTNELTFIYLISNLSGIGPSHINYFGIDKLTRDEVHKWKLWYELNYCKLKYENIVIASYLTEKQLTSKEALEFPTEDMKYIKEIILNKMDTIPCKLRHQVE
jgi:hypothetical protein